MEEDQQAAYKSMFSPASRNVSNSTGLNLVKKQFFGKYDIESNFCKVQNGSVVAGGFLSYRNFQLVKICSE